VAALNDVLVVNAGSTSLKLSLVDADERSLTVASLDEAPPVGLVGHLWGKETRFGLATVDLFRRRGGAEDPGTSE
jgi:hypothetical protein